MFCGIEMVVVYYVWRLFVDLFWVCLFGIANHVMCWLVFVCSVVHGEVVLCFCVTVLG